MFTGMCSLRGVVSLAAAIALVSIAADPAAQSPTYELQLSPQDTTINIDATNYSAQPLLTAYTWPDYQIANAILLKFDLSGLPAGASVQQAMVSLVLVESDATADATYTMTTHKLIGKNPAIAAATGYTADGVTPWTPSACCYNGVPLAQGDISAPYASLAVDKTPGYKAWTITTMVQEWLAAPASNFGLVLNSDATRARDRYRSFASTKHVDASLRPLLLITYSLPPADATPPVISAVASSSITGSAATISWTTNEPADSQVDYGSTAAYGSTTGVNASLVTTHLVHLTGLSDGRLYHDRVVSRDAAGNVAASGDFTFRTPDRTAPAVSISAPAAGTTVPTVVTVAADATDNVGVASVQFRLDGVNLGAKDTTAPYAISWNTTTAAAGSRTLTAVAKDAAGNSATSAGVTVTVGSSNPVLVLTPQDTSLNLNTTNYSSDPTLTTYTWPDHQVANAILMAFDLSSVPAGAVVQQAILQLTLVQADTAAAATYSVSAHKVVSGTPVIASATGYTADGVTPWTANTCCSNNVPLAQADISTPYDTQAIDKTIGSRSWTITAMVREWLADPASNRGLLLNSDASTLRDRYRSFASVENPDPTLRPSLRVTYTIVPDTTPPVISGVTSSAVTASGATIAWTTNEASDSQVEYGTTTAYGSLTALNASRVTSHAMTLSGLAATATYHVRVRSKDAAGNLAISGDFTFTTLAAPDVTPPAVSLTAPGAGATVSGSTVTVAAAATDDVGVVGVQFKLDGTNLGAEVVGGTSSITWNTTLAANGSHTLTAVARDAAGHSTTSPGVVVTVANAIGGLWPNEPAGLTLLTDWGLDQDPPTAGDVPIPGSPGWKIVSQAAPGSPRGWVARVADASAPFSPSNVYDFVYPQGMVEGNAPGTVYYDGINKNEVYVGFWWKPSSPLDYGPNGNKIAFIFNGGGDTGGQQFMILLPDGKLHVLPEYTGDFRWRDPNVNATPVTLGAWHRIEWYSNVATGTLKWWLDGVLQGSHTDVRNPFKFDMFQFSPTWGGNIGAQKHETDHYWFDHVHLSVR